MFAQPEGTTRVANTSIRGSSDRDGKRRSAGNGAVNATSGLPPVAAMRAATPLEEPRRDDLCQNPGHRSDFHASGTTGQDMSCHGAKRSGLKVASMGGSAPVATSWASSSPTMRPSVAPLWLKAT